VSEGVSWIAAAREAELREYHGGVGRLAVNDHKWMVRAGARRGLSVDMDAGDLQGRQAEGKRVLQVAVGETYLAAVTLGGECAARGRSG
jgi:hypothetical protein